MPPLRKFNKENIIDVAYNIVEKEGLASLNARRIAKELNCSVQPIFHNFANMEDLKEEVFNKIYAKYQSMMIEAKDLEHPYLVKGLAYIEFAKTYPEFFKIIFMQESKKNLEEFALADDDMLKNIFESITQKFAVSQEDLKDFYIKVWIFTHGLACLIATKTVNFTDEEIKTILLNTVQELFRGYKKGK